MRSTNQKNEQTPGNTQDDGVPNEPQAGVRGCLDPPGPLSLVARPKIAAYEGEAHRQRGQASAEMHAQNQWGGAVRAGVKWAGGGAKSPMNLGGEALGGRPPAPHSQQTRPPDIIDQGEPPARSFSKETPPTSLVSRPSVFARQDPQWECFEIGPPRRSEPADDSEKRKLCTKTSAGILLCRVHPHTNRPEVILVHKRYTYAFSEFVYGRYSRQNQKVLMALFEQMTTEELLDVWSLNFEQMWYRIWLLGPRRELFTKKHTKFYTSFIRDDGGKALQQMLRQVQDRGVPFWEIPKGRPNGKEGDLVCAMREFTEETGIEKKDYRLLPGVKRRVSFVHMGVRYVHVYYVAVASARLYSEARSGWRRPVVPGRGVLSTADFMGEVDEVRWMDIEHVRFVDDGSGHLEAIIAPAFRLAKCFLRGRWDQRRARPANISSLDPGMIGALASLATSAPTEPGADGSGGIDHAPGAAQWETKSAALGRPATKNPGNEIFRALLGLEYGQGTRRAARRAARRQRASQKSRGPASARSAESGKYDEKCGGKAVLRGARLSAAVAVGGEKRDAFVPRWGVEDPPKRQADGHSSAPSRGQSPTPGGEPRPSTPDQIARRAAAAISRSRTPSAEALLKNLALTEIHPVQSETVVVATPAVMGPEKARDPTVQRDVGPNNFSLSAAPNAVKFTGNSGSYMGALGLGSGPRDTAQISSATDDEALAAARRSTNTATRKTKLFEPPTLSKCESLEGTFGQSRPRGDREPPWGAPKTGPHPRGSKPQKTAGPPERRKAASSADEGWSFVQRRSKKKQAVDEKNVRPADPSTKTAPRFGPRRGKGSVAQSQRS